MQKKLLATVVASMVAGQAMAVEVYNDETTSLSIGGRLGFTDTKVNGSDHAAGNDSARINFKFAHQFDNGWTGSAVAEWGFRAKNDNAGGANDIFNSRLGNVGLSHEEIGSITAGKNWSVMYDITSWTDSMAIATSSAMGIYDGRVSGDFDGTSRADDVIQYRNSFNGLNVGVQYQMADTTGHDEAADRTKRKGGYGVALSYDLPMGMSAGLTHNKTEYSNKDNSKSTSLGLRFAGEELTVAFAASDLRYATKVGGAAEVSEKARGMELFGEYSLDSVKDGLAIQAKYDHLTDKTSGSSAKDKKFALAPVYRTGPMQFAFEWAHDRNTDTNGVKTQDDTYSIQARYYF